jgi:hypothetical protein
MSRISVVSLFVCGFVLLSYSIFAQSLVWSRNYSVNIYANRDLFKRIVGVDSNAIYTFGQSSRFKVYGYSLYPGFGYFNSALITRIRSNGDTLWSKNLFTPGEPRDVVIAPNGNFKVLTQPLFFRDTSIRRPAISIIEVDTAGIVLNEKTYQVPIPNQVIQGMFQARNGDLVVYGYSTPGTLFANTQCDWLLMRIGVDGRMKWHKVYNPLARFACGCTASEDFDDKILMVGIKDDDIAWQSVDSSGVIVSPPINMGLSMPNGQMASYMWNRFPDGGYFLNATVITNVQAWHYLRKYDAAGQQLWNRRVIGGSATRSLLNQDGSVVVNWYDRATRFYKVEKLSATGSSVWTCNLFQTGLSQDYPKGDFTDAMYFPDESAVICGSVDPDGRGYLGRLARISNFGNRFSPVSIPDSKWPASGAFEVPVPYPNPASDVVQFRYLDQQGNITLYGPQGQLVAQYEILPGQALSTTGLASGTYFWRLSAGNKLWSGRLVRE